MLQCQAIILNCTASYHTMLYLIDLVTVNQLWLSMYVLFDIMGLLFTFLIFNRNARFIFFSAVFRQRVTFETGTLCLSDNI